jgi:acyl-[acyl-carrier-protein]-phospholipid O-acyltransferase/long-chain-fatty-acid--[acyl-carrier-protein] ligase
METEQRTLAQQVLGQAHRSPFSTAVTDLQGSISRIELAGAALAMIPHFKLDADEKHVGVLLPPGVAGSLVNLALALDGRTSVNLNHTVGSQGLTRMAEIAGLRTIITADAYLKRISVDDLPGRVLRLESLKAGISFWSVLRAMAAVLLLPHRWLCRGEAADVATVIFSSGSTGDPKGVQLTHRGILANIDGVRRHLSLQQGHDRLLNPLPLFHSFGCSTGTWLPLCLGLPIIAHGDPNDGRTITRLAREHRPTFMVGTPTFVRSWMRRAEDDDFGSLTFAMVGAEKCPRDLAESFKQRFGADLLEGYGATELAPAIATGAPNLPIDGGVEINNAPGSVGRVLPGIAVSIHDVDSGEKLPAGADGMIIIRSPAVMQGYLGRDDLTEKVLDAHGYHTGDIGHLDEHGFLHITGRLARFAKIGGEMVPLDRIENDLRKALCEGHGDDWGDLAVAAVPDASRGERLLVLYTALPIEAAELIDLLADHPPIFRPRARDLHQVASLPVLGTGKRDLAALKAMAADFA